MPVPLNLPLPYLPGPGHTRGMTSPPRLILPDGRIHILQGSCTIGRHASNDIHLEDNEVSRQHALLQWQGVQGENSPGAFLLVDLGSSNGTSVNGQRISKPVRLKDGDALEFGGVRIEFRMDGFNGDSESDSIGSTMINIRKRNAFLMIADIVGSTRLSQELPPEQVPLINGAWFKSCRELVEARGGQMNQYLGDGFFCFWEDTLDARQQLPVLLRQFEGMQRTAAPRFRIVIHFGITVFGSVPTMSALNLHGPTVNYAFRMEKLAGSLGESMLLSQEAVEALRLPVRATHMAELSGFQGQFKFGVPDLG